MTLGPDPIPPPDVDDIRLRAMMFRRVEDARRSMLEAVRSEGGSRQSHSKGSFLMHQGDPATAGFVIDDGHVKVGRLLNDGSHVILKVAPGGDFVGLVETIAELPYTRYARALSDVVVWRLDRARILELLDTNRQFARAMLIVNSVRFLEAQVSVAELRSGPIKARLVQLLMKMAHETTFGCRDGVTVEMELDQEEMASIIGTTRQSVSSLLTSLRRAGLIRGGHRTIEIPTWDSLLAWAHTED